MGIFLKDDGGYQPHCEDCGVALCWCLIEPEYIQNKEFWDNWVCSTCNPEYKLNKENKTLRENIRKNSNGN